MARRDIEDWLWSLDESFRRLSERGARHLPGVASRRCWQPHIDLTEDDREFTLRAELAGVAPDDVQVFYLADRHSILLRGVRIEEPGADRQRVAAHQLEIFYGEFEREVRLPDAAVEAESIKVGWWNGMLIVSVPKAQVKVNRTRITIRRV